ncbi:hypothetical protein [Ottowia sp. VDI28]|uniref:hypothetical protein n=1 Tax=Ottowia sp. VDI28 TaxID=3133968 RepID=UPI003C302CA0
MDKKTAAILLASLLERIERDHAIGAASSHERQALRLAVQALGGEDVPPVLPPPAPHIVVVPPVEPPRIDLVLSSIQRKRKPNRMH